MPADAQDLIRRYADLQEEHTGWRADWQDLADYIHPVRSGFTSRRMSGAKKTTRLFDGTALAANRRLAASMAGSLTSRAFQWFSLKFRYDALNENHDAVAWLEDCAHRMYRAYNHSNFAAEIHEMFLDLGALGTGAILNDEREPDGDKFAGFVFRALPLSEYVIDEDAEGRVDTLFRTFDLSVGAAFREYPGKLGEKAIQLQKAGKLHQRLNFLHAVYPREDGERGPNVPNTKMPWASCTVEMGEKVLVRESGYPEFPFMVPRWEKASSERYGTGPGHLALPDVKTLNRAIELGLKTWAKCLNAPTKSLDDGVIGPIDNVPGGNTVVRQMDALAPLYPPGTFSEGASINQINVTETRTAIRRIFYSDQLELPISGGPMTATEVLKRLELMQRLLGPTLGRIETELLNPTISCNFGIMLRRGAFDMEALAAWQGALPPDFEIAEIDVEYEGPLAKAQRLAEVEGMERLQAFIAAIYPFRPDVVDNVNYDEEVQEFADIIGVRKKLINSREKVEEIRADRAEKEQREQEMSDEERSAAAIGKAGPGLMAMQGGAGAAQR